MMQLFVPSVRDILRKKISPVRCLMLHYPAYAENERPPVPALNTTVNEKFNSLEN